MITPYDPLRGIDFYLDASGEDDWSINAKQFYLLGFMVCAPSSEWIRWIETHRTKFDGMIHWSDGRCGRQKQKLPNIKGECRALLAAHPWLQTGICAFDVKTFKDFLRKKLNRDITRYEVTRRLWRIEAVSYLKMLIPYLKEAVPSDPWGCLNVRDIVINNPKGGNRGLIEGSVKEEFGRTPKFVPAGHYGIDALDGVLWAFQRCLNLGKTDCLPGHPRDFADDFNVVVLGMKSDKPILLRNIRDIEAFKNGNVLTLETVDPRKP